LAERSGPIPLPGAPWRDFNGCQSVNTRVPGRPLLKATSIGVSVSRLDADLMAPLRMCTETYHLLRSIFRVSVAEPRLPMGDSSPSVVGDYQLMGDGIRFGPYIPFESGISYQAVFDSRSLVHHHTRFSDVATFAFSLPKEQTALPTEATHIFPSSGRLPENLLRFHVCFSNPMQRGRAAAEISLLGPDGEPATDALYRAPVELSPAERICIKATGLKFR
jgi:hypothetical protein